MCVNNGNGLIEGHDIRLWNSAGTLLASARVNAGTVNPLSANGLFRTVAISNILLPQGNNYAVGAFFLSNNFTSLDPYAFGFQTVTTPSQIAFVDGATSEGFPSSLTFPTVRTSTLNQSGAPGGNFEFVPVVTAVPFEFSPALGLSVLGGLWVGSRSIKKAKAAKKSV